VLSCVQELDDAKKTGRMFSGEPFDVQMKVPWWEVNFVVMLDVVMFDSA
jgi:hypothetical protein